MLLNYGPSNQLTPWNKVFLETLTGPIHSDCQEILRLLMEPEGSSPCTQEPPAGPYLEPRNSCPHIPSCFLKIHLNSIFLSTSMSSKWSFPFRFFTQHFMCMRGIQEIRTMTGNTAEAWYLYCSSSGSDMLRVWFSCSPFVPSECGVKMVATLEVCTKDEQH
jgi:hypothetical protein